MNMDFVNLTRENLGDEHLCCIIRSQNPHPGVEAKRRWLSDRLEEGHVFRKLNEKATVFMEYAPLETAWVPVVGENYLYIYCLWVSGEHKGRGYGKALMEYCLEDARKKGNSGVCMLGAEKLKAWLSDQAFAKRYGFEAVDRTESGYELLARSLDGTIPRFTAEARRERIDAQELTVYYDMQCPFIAQRVEKLRQYCDQKGVPASFIQVDSLQKAKQVPGAFNNWAVFYRGRLQTVNQIDAAQLERILKKG